MPAVAASAHCPQPPSQGSRYLRRRPERTALHRVVHAHLESFLESHAARDQPLPQFVERELRAYLDCGLLEHGFARFRCSDCAHERLIAFSCKGRGVCPSCGGRRMTELAAHLVDHVIPDVPVRQWVLSLPHGLRYRLGYDHDLCRALLCIVIRVIRAFYRRRALGHPDIETGTVTFIQRFGSALNLNLHFHINALDGGFIEAADGSLRFLPAPTPTPDDMQRIVTTIHSRVARHLRRRGLLDADDITDELTRDDPTLARMYGASVTGRGASGRGILRHLLPGRARVRPSSAIHASFDGFDLHAAQRVAASHRDQLERMLRYCARPAIANDRISLREDGRVAVRLKTPWSDGTSELIFEPLDFMARLVPLIPAPRKNLVLYHGVLSANHRLRSRVVERSRPLRNDAGDARSSGRRGGRAWAELMRRAFALDVLACPGCGGKLRLLATITQPEVIRAILKARGLPFEPQPPAPARGPPGDDGCWAA